MKERSSFFINGIFLTAVAVCARAVGLFFNAYVSANVGAQGMGMYTLVTTVYGFALTFATAGISLTVTNLVASAIGEGRACDIGNILRASMVYAVSFGAVASIVLWCLAPMLAVRVLGDADLYVALRYLSMALIPESLSAVLFGYFVGVRRVIGNAVTQIAAQGFKILLTVVCVARANVVGAVNACICLAAVSLLSDVLGCLLQCVRFFIDQRAKNANKTVPFSLCLRSVAGMALPIGCSAYIRSALLTVEHALIPLCLQMRGESVEESFASYGLLHAMTLPVLLFPMAALSSFSSLLIPEYAEASAAKETGRMSRITARALRVTMTYAVLVSVLLAVFAEEIGYTLYGSYDVGYYLARMAPVIPLMYLDHVTDSMLKGIGEQVYSMWVNISDAFLSVLLVRLLIPHMGIGGYAFVIVFMEGYNFLFSFLRLRRCIPFSFSLASSVFVPLGTAFGVSVLTKHIFYMNGASTQPLWLWMQILFASSLCIGLLLLFHVFFQASFRSFSAKCIKKFFSFGHSVCRETKKDKRAEKKTCLFNFKHI